MTLFKNYYGDMLNSLSKDSMYFAGFDLDHTIIRPKSKNVFPKNLDDWRLLYDITKQKLEKLKNSHIIIIFSNQKNAQDNFISKIDNIAKVLNIPFIFIAAKDETAYNDHYLRKPDIGMYRYVKQFLRDNYNIKLKKKKSFYVGDMAGRKNDRYDTDHKFALNIGIPFFTPEEYFLGEPESKKELSGYLLDYKKYTEYPQIKCKANLAIIVSGYPGSGKSFLAKQYDCFSHISKDKYKNQFNKMLIEKAKEGQPMIIEGLYPTNKSRYELKNILKKYNYKIIYIHMLASYNLSYHMNLYRGVENINNRVSQLVFLKYRKDFEEIIPSDWDEYMEYHMNIPEDANKYYLF
jgi:bifunctional polynucleotide phosphatase/kinase